MTHATYDKARAQALRKLLTKPMRATDIVRHFGHDERYRYAVHNMVASGELVNLNPVPKSPGLFMLAKLAPADAVQRAANRPKGKRVGRPPGSGVRPMTLDFRTGAHLQTVWGGAA